MKTVKMSDKLHAYLGFAAKSRQIVCGADTCEKAIKNGSALAVLIAADAGANTKKHFADMANYRNIPCAFVEDEPLGGTVGKDVKTVCITGRGFADAVIKEINLWGTENE